MSYDVLFVIPHLGPGGAQKVVKLVSSRWAEQGIRVGLLTLYGRDEAHTISERVIRKRLSFEEIPNGVQRSAFTKLSASFVKRIARMETLLMKIFMKEDRAWIEEFYTRLRVKLRENRNLSELFQDLHLLKLETIVDQETEHLGIEYILGYNERQQLPLLREAILELQPRVIVSFLTNTNIKMLLAAEGMDIPIIISERNDMERQEIKEHWRRLRDLKYPEAEIVTANTQGALESLSGFVPSSKLLLLPNPVTLPDLPPEASRENRFVVACRFEPQKAVDITINAFSQFARKHPDWELHLLGDGPVRKQLEALSQRLGMTNRIFFHGFVSDVESHMLKSRGFVLASRYEGVPNAMLEAMACALPTIASNASPGPLEFIKDGATGFVFKVDAVEELAANMARLADDPSLAREMGNKARQRIEDYVSASLHDTWDTILKKVGMTEIGQGQATQ